MLHTTLPQIVFCAFLLLSMLTGSKGFIKCHEKCPQSQILYSNRRKDAQLEFSPCESQCALCAEGKTYNIEDVITCTDPELPDVECTHNTETVTVHVTKLSLTSSDPHTFNMTLKFKCDKESVLSEHLLTVPVTLNVLEVDLQFIENGIGRLIEMKESEHAVAEDNTLTNIDPQVKEHTYTEGNPITLKCKIDGPVPRDAILLMYFHHDTTDNFFACSDHDNEPQKQSSTGKTRKISQTMCDLELNNCEISDAGKYFCHVYITGKTGLYMYVPSENVTVQVDANFQKAMLDLGLEIGVPGLSIFIVLILVITSITILLTIKWKERNNPRENNLRNHPPNEQDPLLDPRGGQRQGMHRNDSDRHRQVMQHIEQDSDSDTSWDPGSPILSFDTESEDRPGGETSRATSVFHDLRYREAITQDQPHAVVEVESDFGGYGSTVEQEKRQSRTSRSRQAPTEFYTEPPDPRPTEVREPYIETTPSPRTQASPHRSASADHLSSEGSDLLSTEGSEHSKLSDVSLKDQVDHKPDNSNEVEHINI